MLCLLYVALTRARHSLHLFVRPPAAGPTPANLLRHALTNISEALPDGGTRLYASGDEDWHGHAPPTEPAARRSLPYAQSSATSPPTARAALDVITASRRPSQICCGWIEMRHQGL